MERIGNGISSVMQQIRNQGKFCHARELISDNELHRLAEKYHHRHPTFTTDIQERTCHYIILACVYHYRHIEVDLRCQCVYNERWHKFESIWSTDHIQYQEILQEIFTRLNSSLINRSLDDQIQMIIEHMTKYFTRLKSIREEQRSAPAQRIPRREFPASIFP